MYIHDWLSIGFVVSLSVVLGGFLFETNEYLYSDLNNMSCGFFYSGSMNNIQNSPSQLLDNVDNTQGAVIMIGNTGASRAYQLCVSKKGIAVRWKADVWTQWNCLLFS